MEEEHSDRELIFLLAGRLPAYQRAHRRPLPWREDPTPYRVWISEIMLQQTRIEAVIPYYRRFLAELPDVAALAACEDDRLMKLWQGLGYYSRARNLKAAAGKILSDFGGVLPREPEKLMTLPGIGAYTAGAIASIAYGMPAPAVDGNVLRVLTRVLASPEDIAAEKTKKRFTDLLCEAYPTGEDARMLTEGLMELGETVCIPNGDAKCDLCPLADLCRANRGKITDLFPVKTPKKPRRIEEYTVLLLECDGTFAVVRRPAGGLLAGLYLFPMLDGFRSEDEIAALYPRARTVAALPEGKHIFTHIEWHMRGFAVRLDTRPEGMLFVTPEDLSARYAVPTAHRHFERLLQDRRKGTAK